MAGLKGRLSTVVKSKISKQLDRAETPSETLDYAYERQVENLQNVKKGIADIVTAKKRLMLQQQQLGEQGAKLDAQAREAMAAGREDLARAARGRTASGRRSARVAPRAAGEANTPRLKAEVQSGAPQSALPAGDTGTADHPEAQQPAAGDGEAPPPG